MRIKKLHANLQYISGVSKLIHKGLMWMEISVKNHQEPHMWIRLDCNSYIIANLLLVKKKDEL